MTAAAPKRPRQVPDLEISQIVDGYVVYDPATNCVHYLNHTAAVVLELCDGELPVDRIVDLVRSAWDLPARPVDEVEACVARFEKVGLVVDTSVTASAGGGEHQPDGR